MSYKDTLTIYNELKACGINEEQAQIQAKQLGGVSNALDDLRNEFRLGFDKIDKDLYWMRLIGGAMIIAFMGNIIAMWVKG